MPSVRRLTAILAADVAGYSRLMGADEEGTHERLKAHLGELVNPKIKEQRGRIVKNTGDGFLAEFQSVVDAVRCAVEVQREMADANAAIPPEKRIEFRVGINFGDVIVEGEDIFGDGVNIAARLERLAEPGGICVSRVVRDQVRDRLDFGFEDLGEQSVKNIVRPVRVYALRPKNGADLPALSVPPTMSIAQLTAMPRLSIVVLPFINLSDDREQQYFADGITDDLTTDLSRIGGMFVISRNTAFTYRNKPVDAKQIGRELGVHYLLEGSVRRSNNRVRVNVQLISTETGAHLWADRFDHDTDDLFALQHEITSRIAVELNIELIGAEAARPTQHPKALDYVLRGRAALNRPPSRDSIREAINMFERALALAPQSFAIQSLLAIALTARVLDRLANSPTADIARAEELAGRALAAAPRSPLAHSAKGLVLRAQHRYEEAILEYEMVISVNRNWPHAYAELGRCKFYTGRVEEMIPLVEQAIRISPRDGQIGSWYSRIGVAHLLQSRTDEAILWLEKARNAAPELPFVHAQLASAYALAGDAERASVELADARKFNRNGRYSSIAHLRATGDFGVPTVRALYEATYFAGLRKAGMPEE